MKKCNYCSEAAKTNLVVMTSNGKKKIPCCDNCMNKGQIDAQKVKRGHIEKIKIYEPADMKITDDYDFVNGISLLAGRIKIAADKFMNDHKTTFVNEEKVELHNIDIKGNLIGSLLEDEIPAMETLGQYAKKLHVLLVSIENE